MVAVCAAACGGGPGASGTVADLAEAICGVTFRCCSSGEAAYRLGPFVDRWSCADRLLQEAEIEDTTGFVVPAGNGVITVPNVAVLDRAVEEERVEIDEAALQECLDYLRELSCNSYEPPSDNTDECVRPDPPAENPCETARLFHGRVKTGETCTSVGTTLECVAGSECRAVDSLGVSGVCVELGREGDFCFEDGDCEDSLYCSLLDGTCRVPGGEGDACLFADRDDPHPSKLTLLLECDEQLNCDPVTDTCVGLCERGASCAFDYHCDEALGLRCIAGRCDLPRDIGNLCEETADCVDGLYCGPGAVSGLEYFCWPPRANGETCPSGSADACESGFCNQNNLRCEAPVPTGGLCPSGQHSQCDGGYCKTEYTYCESDDDCPDSGQCNLGWSSCEYYCLPLRVDGVSCDYGFQCESGACVVGICRRLPLPYGVACSDDSVCESSFCNFQVPRVCDELPLADGKSCSTNEQCYSGVCYAGTCSVGLTEGMACSVSSGAPCARDLFCDYEAVTPICTPVREAGASCESLLQCRGSCLIRFNRYMCDDTPGYLAAVCDGE